MLHVSDLFTAYGKIEALKGVSLHAERGRITCLLGPNGAGKTTLMMSIAGILKPSRGSIRLEGAELRGLVPAKIVARGVALVPENRLVFPQLSVRENLSAGAYQRDDKPEIAADIERMYALPAEQSPSRGHERWVGSDAPSGWRLSFLQPSPSRMPIPAMSGTRRRSWWRRAAVIAATTRSASTDIIRRSGRWPAPDPAKPLSWTRATRSTAT